MSRGATMRVGSALLLAALLVGCADAIYTRTRHRSHEAYTEQSYAAFRQLQATGDAVTKAQVLGSLGPPLEVIRQAEGEVFVYRRVGRNVDVLDLNPGQVSGLTPVDVPIFYQAWIEDRDDTLMIFFDAEGKMVGEGQRLAVEEGF